MYFNKINLNKISITKTKSNFFKVNYNDGIFIFDTPYLYNIFGLEKFFILKLQLRKVKNDIQEFLMFLKSLEIKLQELTHKEIQSQIIESESYDELLITKFINRNNKIIVDIKNNKNENLNIYNLEKKIFIKASLVLDTLFLKDNKIYYKFKIKYIETE